MTALCSKKRRGFNLIEAAIVLAVVGLVVAGVWVAAAAISEKREINNVKDFILVYSTQTGHSFHAKLDSDSTANWTVGA